jgi:glutathione S-transferase
MSDVHRLYYWPNLQGRGEFVRLVLEAAGVPYEDVARVHPDGAREVMAFMTADREGQLPFAPPVLVVGEHVLAQMPVIVRYLGEAHGLAGTDPIANAHVQQLVLTWCDVVDEVHAVHHPVSTAWFYEQQRDEAIVAARLFRDERLVRWLQWGERTLQRHGGDWLAGSRMTVADLAAFQVVTGLRHMFPVAMGRTRGRHPGLMALVDRVAAVPRVAAYLESDRRIPFNLDGIFRAYPELDG